MILQVASIISAVLVLMLVVILLAILSSAIRIIPEYQRAVKFRLGRVVGVVGPGLVLIIPVIDRLLVFDLRVITVDVPAQKALTKDNVEVTIDAAVYLRVIDPLKTALTVREHVTASSLLAAATLRDVVGTVDLDTLLTQREEIAKRIAGAVDAQVSPWGIKVSAVAIKDIRLPEMLVRAMASQAEAERVRRAKITLAQAEYDASRLYIEAAENYAKNHIAVNLRQIDALIEIAREKNLIMVVPSNLEMVSMPAAMALAMRKKEGE